MNQVVLSLCLIWSFAAMAAIPRTTGAKTAYEILRLPSENQKSLIEQQPDQIYRNFLDIAFDESEGMTIRWKAIMAAGQMRKEKATPDLLKASKSRQWYMRNAAMVALNEYNRKEGEKLAKSLLKDKALVVRSAAVEVLSKNSEPQVRDLLWEELHQKYNFKNRKSLWIRPQILKELSKKPTDHETSLFARALQESELEMQLIAVRGLEKLTGTKLGEARTPSTKLVQLWQNYYNQK